MTDTLAEVIPKEQARVRQLIQQYRALGHAGSFAAMMMEGSLRKADRALASGDVVAMIRARQDLRGYK